MPEKIPVTRVSIITQKEHTMEIAITKAQLKEIAISGRLIQNVVPHLTPEEREFLLNGITPEEWDTHLGPETIECFECGTEIDKFSVCYVCNSDDEEPF